MAKITKGGKIKSGDDKTVNYAVYTSRGKLLRRAAHPEYYLHSWSYKVKRNRDLFAQAMVEYSKMDIVTKQAYKEAIRIRPIVTHPKTIRWIYDKVRRKIEEIRKKYNLAVPHYFYQYSPYYKGLLYTWPGIDPEAWEEYLRRIGINKYYRPGPNQWIYDYYGWIDNRDKEPQPFPNEVPLPQMEYPDLLKGRVPVTTLVIKIKPTGISGAVYNAYIHVKSEYHEIKKFISAHKEEVIIIVVIGAFILLGWTVLLHGGLELTGGSALIHETVATPAVLSALSLLGLDYQVIKDYFYKELVIGWAEDINIWAWNDTRLRPCYIEQTTSDTTVMWDIYEGETADAKGRLGAWVKLEVDPEEQTGQITWGCGESDERIVVFMNGAEILRCNIGLTPYDIIDVWDNTNKEWLQAEVEYNDNQKIYHFYQGGYGCGEIDAYAYPYASPIAWGVYVCWLGGTKYFSWSGTPTWDGKFHDVPCDQIEGYVREQIWPAPHWYLIVFTGHQGYFLDPASLPSWPGSCSEAKREAVTVIETFNENGQVVDITVQPKDYTGELFVYWRGLLIAYLPPRGT